MSPQSTTKFGFRRLPANSVRRFFPKGNITNYTPLYELRVARSFLAKSFRILASCGVVAFFAASWNDVMADFTSSIPK